MTRGILPFPANPLGERKRGKNLTFHIFDDIVSKDTEIPTTDPCPKGLVHDSLKPSGCDENDVPRGTIFAGAVPEMRTRI